MKIAIFTCNPFEENCYIVHGADGSDAAIVDPGMMADSERDHVAQYITAHSLNVKYILLTHCHIDHVASADWAAQHYGAPVMGSADDLYLVDRLAEQVQRFHLNIDVPTFRLDRELTDGEQFTLNGETVKVIATPGHSRGSISFYLPDTNAVLTGDTLFAQSMGRTDLPGGDLHTLLNSIRQRLLTLPTDTLVVPGHSQPTTILAEQPLYAT